MGKGGAVEKDSFTTILPTVVKKLLFYTKYAGKFGSKTQNGYACSWGIKREDYILGKAINDKNCAQFLKEKIELQNKHQMK